MRALWLAVGIGVGLALAPTPTVQQTHVVEIVEVQGSPDWGLTCDQATPHPDWDGELEGEDGRTDCLIRMVELWGWDMTFGSLAVLSDFADLRHGGPCGAVTHFEEWGTW